MLGQPRPGTQSVREPRIAAAMVVAEWLFCELVARDWIRIFLKAGHEQRYLHVFFILLGASLLLADKYRAHWSRTKSVVIGALLGHLCSMAALEIYGLLLPFGVEHFANMLKLDPVDVLLAGMLGALVLGGWLFGAILFLCATWTRAGAAR